DEAVRRELVYAAASPGRENRRLPLERGHRPRAEIHRDDPGARAAIEDEGGDEGLVEPMDLLVLHRSLEEGVLDVESDLVRGVHGPLDGHPADGALAHAPRLV